MPVGHVCPLSPLLISLPAMALIYVHKHEERERGKKDNQMMFKKSDVKREENRMD